MLRWFFFPVVFFLTSTLVVLKNELKDSKTLLRVKRNGRIGVLILWGKMNCSCNVELNVWISSYETLSKIFYTSIYRISNQISVGIQHALTVLSSLSAVGIKWIQRC